MTILQSNTRVIIEVSHKINGNFKRKILMVDLIKEFRLSASTLTKGFKLVYKQTIYQYKLVKAMQYVAECIGEGVELSQLANELGYYNSKSLARAFKQVYGLAPKTTNLIPFQFDGQGEMENYQKRGGRKQNKNQSYNFK
jgi:AraC-like DNA-binding protein